MKERGKIQVKNRWLPLIITALLLSIIPIYAQDNTSSGNVEVPDVSGLTHPQAAAALNRAGLAVGRITSTTQPISPDAAADTVTLQTPPAGQSVAAGSAVDLALYRTPNALVIYDDNDLTLVSQANRRIQLRNIRFVTRQAAANAEFEGGRWGARLRPGYCVQVWSVGRSSPKDLPECRGMEAWLTTNRPQEHFWTTSNGVQSFAVIQNGQERAICDAAPPSAANSPMTCNFYLDTAGANTNTEFVYFAYTTDSFFVVNRTPDAWMPLSTSTIVNKNPNPAGFGAQFVLGDAATFGNPTIVADITRLAPGQCSGFRVAGTSTELPEPCDVTTVRDVNAEQPFWRFDFELLSSDGKTRVCRAAVPGKLTLCVMPR